MPEIVTLSALFEDELRDVYDAETQIVRALPTLIDAVGADQLARGARGPSRGDPGPDRAPRSRVRVSRVERWRHALSGHGRHSRRSRGVDGGRRP